MVRTATSSSTRYGNGASLIRRLREVAVSYSPDSAATKLRLLVELDATEIHLPAALKTLHRTCLFLAAFPDDREVHRAAMSILDGFPKRVGRLPRKVVAALVDSGIAGSSLSYRYSNGSADWLVDRFPGQASIDWPGFENPEALFDILELLGHGSEQQIFDDRSTRARDWMRLACGRTPDLEWLLRQMRIHAGLLPALEAMYDALDLPVRWSLADCRASKSGNRLPVSRLSCRMHGPRRFRPGRNSYTTSGAAPVLCDHAEAEELIDAAKAAIFIRHREVYSHQHANPAEVYVANAGGGVKIVFLGVLPARRLTLEANYGYVIFANGVPVGYGGVTTLFRQANTGINIFDEFRGGESASMFAAVIRAAHRLFGCRRFIVNPYQFGKGNNEALKSGAYWFYYRMGFRSPDVELRRLAQAEFQRLKRRNSYRTPHSELRRLASSDLHLTLPGAPPGDFFDERRLGTISAACTRAIAAADADRARALKRLQNGIRVRLSLDTTHWTKDEQSSLALLAPIVSLIDDLDDWTPAERRSLGGIIRAKGRLQEREFALRMAAHDRLRRSLARHCRAN